VDALKKIRGVVFVVKRSRDGRKSVAHVLCNHVHTSPFDGVIHVNKPLSKRLPPSSIPFLQVLSALAVSERSFALLRPSSFSRP
jgi:hypothetical protein